MKKNVLPFRLENGTKIYPIRAFAEYLGVSMEEARKGFKGLQVPLVVVEGEDQDEYYYLGLTLAMAILVCMDFGGPGFKIRTEFSKKGKYPEPEIIPPEFLTEKNLSRLQRTFERTLLEYSYRRRQIIKQEMLSAFKQLTKKES